MEKIQAENAQLRANYIKLEDSRKKEIEHLKNEWEKLRKTCKDAYDKLKSKYIESKKNASKMQEESQQKLRSMQSEINLKNEQLRDKEKLVEWYRGKFSETVHRYTEREEIWRTETQKKDIEAFQMQTQIDQNNKELKDVITKAQMFKFEDYVNNKTWIVLHEGGINCLVDVSQFENFVRENSISMINTEIFHSDQGDYSITFQKNSGVTMTHSDKQVSIELQYDKAMQLFAWMKDKLNNSGDPDEKSKLTNLTDDNLLSHEFLLQMQQDEFECATCYASTPSQVIVCFKCGHRMHLSCITQHKCIICRHEFLRKGIDYEYLDTHPEMLPKILIEPLAQVKNEQLRTNIENLHGHPMRADFAGTLQLGRYAF